MSEDQTDYPTNTVGIDDTGVRLSCLSLSLGASDHVTEARRLYEFATGSTATATEAVESQVTEKEFVEALRASYADDCKTPGPGPGPGVVGCGNQAMSGHLHFQRSDGVASLSIDRYVDGEQAGELEVILRKFFADADLRAMKEAMQAKDEISRKVSYARQMGAGPLVGR